MTNENGKKKRVRSSPYPYYDLGKCIELLKMIFDEAKSFEVPIEKGIRAMDLSPDSSTGIRAIAALSMFNLLDQRRDGDTRYVKISELGRKIILSTLELGGKGNLVLIKEAALTPPIINHFWNKYSETGLPKDSVLEIHLLNDKDYIVSDVAASSLVSVLRQTIDYAELTSKSDDAEKAHNSNISGDIEVGKVRDEMQDNLHREQDVKSETYNYPQKNEELNHVYPLGDGRNLKFSIPDDISERELRLFNNWVSFVIEQTLALRNQKQPTLGVNSDS